MRQGGGRREVTVAILSVLPVEFAAVRLLIEDPSVEHIASEPGTYVTGAMPSTDPDWPHRVVLSLPHETGIRSTAVEVMRVARSYPGVQAVVVCGLAAGVRSAGAAVQLGDVVVAVDGIVDNDPPRRPVGEVARPERRSSGLSSVLRRADREIAMQEEVGGASMEALIERAESAGPSFRRPQPRRPRIHRGAIGSAGRLIRDVRERDTLAAKYGMLALEMEGAGFAATGDAPPQGWLAVRGISDYGGPEKNDSWRAAAALAAAAYTRVLLGACPPFIPRRLLDDSPVRPSAPQLVELVDLLLDLPVMLDDYERRAVIASLPAGIRAQVPYSPVARLQIVSLLQVCASFQGGMAALLDAVRFAAAPDSVTLRRLSAALEAHSEPSA